MLKNLLSTRTSCVTAQVTWPACASVLSQAVKWAQYKGEIMQEKEFNTMTG